MKHRHRFYECSTGDCPKLRTSPGDCPTHSVPMVAVILRRETPEDKAREQRETADRLKKAGDEVAKAGGVHPNPFGNLEDLFKPR